MIGAALLLAASVAHATARYDCTMEVPKSVARDGSTRQINFPGVAADMWHFTASIDSDADGLPIDVTVAWNGDPIQIAGKHSTVVTAEGSIAFAAASAGPCMFTEAMCLTVVNMARQPDKSLKFVVLPSALSTDEQAHTRAPFVAFAEGSCKEVSG
jgi:hypothetical protein